MEVNQFDVAVKIFDERGAAFHPVAAVQIFNAVNFARLGAVNVAANHAVRVVAARHRGER